MCGVCACGVAWGVTGCVMKSCMGGGVRGRGVYAFVLIAGAGKGWAGVTTQPYSPLYTPPLPLRHPPLSKPNLIHHQPPLSPPQLPSPSIYATYPFPSFSIPLCIIYICQKLSNYTPSLPPPPSSPPPPSTPPAPPTPIASLSSATAQPARHAPMRWRSRC